jgi:hypothetical protein
LGSGVGSSSAGSWGRGRAIEGVGHSTGGGLAGSPRTREVRA